MVGSGVEQKYSSLFLPYTAAKVFFLAVSSVTGHQKMIVIYWDKEEEMDNLVPEHQSL